MKKILILGGYGFIGTNIIKYIDEYLADQYEVIVFDKLLFHSHRIQFKSVIKNYAGDFGDVCLLESIFNNYHIDYVLHSLSTTVPATSSNASFDINSNLLPTIGLLDLMIKYKVFNIIYISSGGAIYGQTQSVVKHKESDDGFPISSYGVVKLAIEKYLFQYHYLHQIEPLVLRLSNPYGCYHYSMKQGVINIALRSALIGEEFSVWGTGEERKDYIFIDDFCEILFKLIEKKVKNKVFNVASGETLSLNQILFAIKKRYPGFSWSYSSRGKCDVVDFELDTTRLMQTLQGYNFLSFEDGVDKTIKWL